MQLSGVCLSVRASVCNVAVALTQPGRRASVARAAAGHSAANAGTATFTVKGTRLNADLFQQFSDGKRRLNVDSVQYVHFIAFLPFVIYPLYTWWLGSRVVDMLDSGAVGPGFKSQPQRCQVTVLGKLLTPIVPLFTKQRNWYQPS